MGNSQTTTLYHATNAQAARMVDREGFRPGAGGHQGGAIYLSSRPEEANYRSQHGYVMYQVHVDLQPGQWTHDGRSYALMDPNQIKSSYSRMGDGFLSYLLAPVFWLVHFGWWVCKLSFFVLYGLLFYTVTVVMYAGVVVLGLFACIGISQFGAILIGAISLPDVVQTVNDMAADVLQ